MDKVNALGTPLGDWDVEIDRLTQAMRADDFSSHDSDSDLLQVSLRLIKLQPGPMDSPDRQTPFHGKGRS